MSDATAYLESKDSAATLEVKLAPLQIKAGVEDEDFLTISGYGSVFGNEDMGGDMVMQGAFLDSIASGRKVKMLYQHDTAQVIGVFDSMSEDSYGLKMQGRISKKFGKGAEVAELIKMGAIEGLSIGFRTKEYSMDEASGQRKLTKLDLFEVSVVTFPMNELASITGMKSENITERDIERTFKDMGYSNRMAKVMAGGAWKGRDDVLRDADKSSPEVNQRDVDDLKALLKSITQTKGT
jgi:hypothetical protein